MENKKNHPDPEKTYREELNDEGSTLFDSEEQSAARDAAKMDKSLKGQSQKIDSVHPDDLKPDRNDEIMEQERSNE